MAMDVALNIIVTVVIIGSGVMLAKIGSRIALWIERRRKGVTLSGSSGSRLVGYSIIFLTVLVALNVFNKDITRDELFLWYTHIPQMVSYILLCVLVIIAVEVIILFLRYIGESLGLANLARDYEWSPVISSILVIVRIILYALFGVFALRVIGVYYAGLGLALGFVLVPLFLLVLLIGFVAVKDYARNISLGMFFRFQHMYREGEQVLHANAVYTIERSTSVGIIAKKKDGYALFIPYASLFSGSTHCRLVRTELDTLEKIQAAFVEQQPSYCGPASAAIILKIFGFDIPQQKIGEMAKTIVPKKGEPGGTHPQSLITIVQKLTGGKVIGVWIPVDKINDLHAEIRSWLHDNALIIIDYKKSALFPKAEKAHYSVCVGVADDELLVVDPSRKTGGVYYAPVHNVMEGMDTYSDLIKGKRGYIVLALEGTPAYHRINKNIIYSDPTLYAQLTREVQKRLKNLLPPQSLKKILPKPVQEYLAEDRVARVWRP